jgi:hypothetical protein
VKSILISIGLLVFASIFGCGGEVFGECGDTIKTESTSPNGRYVATVFERNCGATTDYSTNVSLRETGEAFDPSSQAPILTVAGQPTIALEWSTERTLAVVVPEAQIFKKLEAWRDVLVAYQ